ncbi:MAG: 1-aminocyclopropane-carboxylate deaminase [Kribbellaceae bacterium]|nr:1-aminocyclopropane-carboxylate deaminase [Kribbellaceae bacterium]
MPSRTGCGSPIWIARRTALRPPYSSACARNSATSTWSPKKASLEDDILALQQLPYGSRVGDWRLESGYHFGGYAKRTLALDTFIDDFASRHGLLLDWVYEAKMMYALFDQVRRGSFRPDTTIVALIN